MKKPFIIPDALDTTKGGEFDQVWEELNPEISPWTLSNYSARGENMNVMWIKNDYCALPILRAGATIRLKMERVMRQRLTLVRIHTNGQTKGQVSEFHTDFEDHDTFYTAIHYARPDWNAQWGGNFMVFDGEEYHTYPYIPNRTIVVSAAWDHYGDHPNSFTGKLRATIGFMYCLNSKLDAMCKKYPLKLVNPHL